MCMKNIALIIGPTKLPHEFIIKDIHNADEMVNAIFTMEVRGANSYYEIILERIPESPRFNRYSSELEHLNNDQELAWERGGLGASAVISSGETDCDTMLLIIILLRC